MTEHTHRLAVGNIFLTAWNTFLVVFFFFFNEDLLLVTAGFYISGNVFISSSFLKGSSDSVQFLVGSNYLSTP